MVAIQQNLIPAGAKNIPNINLSAIKGITVHNTGNFKVTADAKTHAEFLANTTDQMSWHYTVDDSSIYQSLLDTQEAWHAADGSYGPGNNTTIAIEMCVNFGFTPEGISISDLPSWADATYEMKAAAQSKFEKTTQNTAQLIANKLKEHSLTINNVVQHNLWSGKDCPYVLRHAIFGSGWNDFIAQIKYYYEGNANMSYNISEAVIVVGKGFTSETTTTGRTENDYSGKILYVIKYVPNTINPYALSIIKEGTS